jgi:hypothetical protein
MENSRQIKFLREGLNSSIDSIEMIMKYCDMMNNQTKKWFLYKINYMRICLLMKNKFVDLIPVEVKRDGEI